MLIKTQHFAAAAILLLLAGVETQHSVTFPSQSLCAVTGSTVKISCTLPYHYGSQTEWYRVQSSTGEAQDLSTDPEYSGRVSVSTKWSHCDLTVRNVSVSDSGVYNFRFKTHTSDWISTSSGVQLTVTDLQVKVDPYSARQGRVKVTCSSTCRLSRPSFHWYRNGMLEKQKYNPLFVVNSIRSSEVVMYACEVLGSSHRSPQVCVLKEKSCWSVTYSTQNICSLIGSSVDIRSYYTFPDGYKVSDMFWFIKKAYGEAVDVREDEEYQGRVQYTQSSQNNCSLRITNLRVRDAQTYRFRFITDAGDYTGEPGVSLSVTDLKVTISNGYNLNKKLSCITTCTPSNKPTYIWYKNGQPVTNQNRNELYVTTFGTDSYSCAIRGHEELHSLAVYSPRDISAVVLSSGDTVEGGSVTLSCSSDANPPVLNYSWFKQRAAADTLLITEQNYSISNIRSQHSGLYYCTAHNLLGQHNSKPILLDSPKNTSAVVLSSGDTVEGGSVTLSCSSDANPPVLNYSWFKQGAAADTLLITEQNYSISNIRSQHSGLYYCTAHNLLGQNNSTLIHLDVLYPPRNILVSGDSNTLLCVSDSNPNSSYTWYRRSEGEVRLVENSTNLFLFPKEDGFYFCTTRNRLGSSNSSEWKYTAGNRAVKYVGSGVTVALVMIFIAVFLGMRYHNWGKELPYSHRSEEYNKNDSAPVYGNVSAMTSDSTPTASSEEQDAVQYTSVYFRPSRIQEVPLYSTVQLPQPLKQEEEVEYATVNLIKSRVVREDEIYSNLKT